MHDEDGVQIRVSRLHRLDAWEAELMRPLLVARGSRLRAFSLAVNRLGNGWLFAAVALLMPLVAGTAGWRFVGVVAIALAVAFSAYLVLKRFVARVRPCHADESFDADVAPLDRYSCPSGHTMTAAIFAVAISITFPAASVAAIAIFLVIAWSRLSLGHHYPSDVILGAWMGTAVALPLSLWLLRP